MEYGYSSYIQGSPLFMASAARRMLANDGCFSWAEGHISVRGEDGESFWMTPWQFQDETLPEHFVHLSFDFQRQGGADLAIGPASQFHVAIYKARPDVNCVIHTHSFNVQVISTTGRCVDTYVGEANFIHGDQAFFGEEQNFHRDGSHPVANAFGKDKHILVMGNHGSICVGASVPDATVRTLMLEYSAKVQVESEKLGGKPFDPNPEYKSDYWSEVAPALWNSNLRRLLRTDPDLRDSEPVAPGTPELRAEFPRRPNPIFEGRGWTPTSFSPEYPGSRRSSLAGIAGR
jgi:L-fuculose-phosphate aldolase